MRRERCKQAARIVCFQEKYGSFGHSCFTTVGGGTHISNLLSDQPVLAALNRV